MDKYLLLLLKEVNTIIIPGLGALTITNEKTGEIMFMPYLNYDDGKLATYIAEKEGFELNDAKNLISKYVREVQTILAKGESYDMFEFGTFLKDKSGDIVFKNWDGSLPSERSFDEINEIETDISIEDQNESEVVENIEIQEELTEEIIPTVEATVEFTEKEEIIEISELEIIDEVEEHEK
ncbi:MAG: hypothetical protein HYR91_12780, partial [Flavobacteriia bacterium]|nr:hypothetical protein [Flavobacteriia bacterium]